MAKKYWDPSWDAEDLKDVAEAVKLLNDFGAWMTEARLKAWTRTSEGPRVTWKEYGRINRALYASADLFSWVETGKPTNDPDRAPPERHKGGRPEGSKNKNKAKATSAVAPDALAEVIRTALAQVVPQKQEILFTVRKLREIADDLERLANR